MNNLKSLIEMCNLAVIPYNTIRKCWNTNPVPFSVSNKYRLYLLTQINDISLSDVEMREYKKECDKKPWLKLVEIHATTLIDKWKTDGSLPLVGINTIPQGVKEYIESLNIDITQYSKSSQSHNDSQTSQSQEFVIAKLNQKKVDPEMFALSLKMMNKLFTELLYSDEKHILSVVKSNTKQLDELTTVLNIVREESPHETFKKSIKLKKIFNE